MKFLIFLFEGDFLNDRIIKRITIITLLAGTSLILIVSAIFILKGNINFKYLLDSELISAFGDFIGGLIGTIFTILATLLIWMTYNSQKEELKKTIQIAEDQASTSRMQNQTMSLQQFETTFFNMTSTILNIPDKIVGILPAIYDYNRKQSLDEFSKERYAGHDFLSMALRTLKVRLKNATDWETLPKDQFENFMEKTYNDFYYIYLGELDHYYRYVYNILKFVDQSNINNKKLYTDLLQAQLSKAELGLLFYNGVGKYGRPKLHPLLEKYNFLENLNRSNFFIPGESLINLYPSTTFKFLSKEKRLEIVAFAIINNTDNEKGSLWDYYAKKYNLSSTDLTFIKQTYRNELDRTVDKIIL